MATVVCVYLDTVVLGVRKISKCKFEFARQCANVFVLLFIILFLVYILLASYRSNRNCDYGIITFYVRYEYEIQYSRIQWLEHHWNHENMFETRVVRLNEC